MGVGLRRSSSGGDVIDPAESPYLSLRGSGVIDR
jgi:hypothetical protein